MPFGKRTTHWTKRKYEKRPKGADFPESHVLLSWNVEKRGDEAYITKIGIRTGGSQAACVILSAVLAKSRNPTLFVRGFKFEQSDAVDSSWSAMRSDSCDEAVKLLDGLSVCSGNFDSRFVRMFSSSRRVFQTKTGLATAVLDSKSPFFAEGLWHEKTIRSVQCQLLVQQSAQRCRMCNRQRASLRVAYSRWKVRSSMPHKFTGNVYLTTPQRKSKFERNAKAEKSKSKKIAFLQQKIARLIAADGIGLSPELDSDMRAIVDTAIVDKDTPEIDEIFPAGSFRRLFWDQQVKAAKTKSKSGMRWHPVMIRLALNIKMISSAAYHALQSSGFVRLPSERTLRDYTHFFKSSPGFSRDLNTWLIEESGIKEAKEAEKFVTIVFDEMKVKDDLVFHKESNEICGFVDLGKVNSQLKDIEVSLAEGNAPVLPVATHMFVLMIRGLVTNLRFPYAHFPTERTAAYHLTTIIWEAIEQLEMSGFKVIAITCDGAAPNRRFFRIHSGDPLCHMTLNPYSVDKRNIHFFSDVPHLVKTTRNCFSHSFKTGKTRSMQLNDKHITWQHIVDLYNRCHKTSDPAGLFLVGKLKLEHVQLTSYSRMRVDLAAQILSNAVANGLEYYEIEGASETVRFCRIFNKAFDCLNSRTLVHRNDDCRGYKSASDERLLWLEEDFLRYLDEWDKWADARPNLSKSDRNRLKLSSETIAGWRITVKSFVSLVRYFFSLKESVGHFILSERLSQDPLEGYFGKQRMRGGRNDNPSVDQCLTNAASIRVQQSIGQEPVRGNSRKRRRLFPEEVISDAPIPKRRRRTKAKADTV